MEATDPKTGEVTLAHEVNLQLIDKGKAAARLDESIQRAARTLVNHVHKHGAKLPGGKAKASVTLKITFGYATDEYSVVAATEIKVPADIATADFLAVAEMPTGQPTLIPADFAPEDQPATGVQDVPGQRKAF